ncbi:hypothetical protein Pelo_13688 [Pelomyxa schiedti]|nr:hypothetical protein Pelo_13688 [Pelomyxa schiedti]
MPPMPVACRSTFVQFQILLGQFLFSKRATVVPRQYCGNETPTTAPASPTESSVPLLFPDEEPQECSQSIKIPSNTRKHHPASLAPGSFLVPYSPPRRYTTEPTGSPPQAQEQSDQLGPEYEVMLRSSLVWGEFPFEQVISNALELENLVRHPFSARNSIAIIEPRQYVGFLGDERRPVRASLNIAYLVRVVADCDSVLFPLWKSGISHEPTSALSLQNLLPVLSSTRGIIVEGGDASVYEPSSFGSTLPHEDIGLLMEGIILDRLMTPSPSIFICLGHQLACDTLNRLIIRAVDEVAEYASKIEREYSTVPQWLQCFVKRCNKIHRVGEQICVTEKGVPIAMGYRDRYFTVCPNTKVEIGKKRLSPFVPLSTIKHQIPQSLLNAHVVTQNSYKMGNIVNLILSYGGSLDIIMFHADRVNCESVFFVNWALRKLHNALIVHKHNIVRSPLSWLLNLPCAVEVCASTRCDVEERYDIVTSVAAVVLYYKDYETGTMHYSFSLQFHPELCDNVRVVGDTDPLGKFIPTYERLQQSDGIRLLCRMLHVSSQ